MNYATALLNTISDKDQKGEIFLTRNLVKFGDVDPAGIAYYPRIHNYVHQAFEDLWNEYVGVQFYDLIQKKRIAFPMKHTEIDFIRPLKFGDRPIIKVTCFKLGRSALGLRYIFEVEGEVCVDAKTITVCINADTFETMEIPNSYREKFQNIMVDLSARKGNLGGGK